MSEPHAPQNRDGSGESGPSGAAATIAATASPQKSQTEVENSVAEARELATSAADVYADRPFAGTIFEKSGRSRSWLDTIPEDRPARLSEVMDDHSPSGTLILELSCGESVEIEVGGGESGQKKGDPRHPTAEKRESWREEGREQVRQKMREERRRMKKRHEEELQIKEKRLQQVRERNSQLQSELHDTRRRKERQIEEERTKRREREEELESKYKSEIEELEEEVRELKEELIDQKAEESRSWVGDVVDLVKEDSQIQALLAQGVSGSQAGANENRSSESRSNPQPAQQPAQQSARQSARQTAGAAARGDGAPARGRHPTENDRHEAQSGRRTGATNERGESPGAGSSPQRRREDGPSGGDGAGDSPRQNRQGPSQQQPSRQAPSQQEPSQVAQVAADCLESILKGEAEDFSERLRANEEVHEWDAQKWTSALHGLAIIGAQNQIPASYLGDFMAHELPYWAGEDMMAQVRAMQGVPTSQTVELITSWMEEEGEDVSDPVREYIHEIVERLKAHDL